MNDLLKSIDPAAAWAERSSLDPRAEADLQLVLAGAETDRAGRRPWYLTAAVVAVITGVLLTLGMVYRPVPAAADPVALSVLSVTGPADISLAKLAATAEQKDPWPSSTALSYTAWDLNARIEGRVTNTAVVITRHERTPHGETIRVRSLVQDVQFPTQASQDAWDQDPQAHVGDVLEDTDVPAAHGMYAGQPAPATPEAMATFLAQGHPIAEYGPGELFVAITDLAQEQTPNGQQTAAILRLLAQTPGVALLGRVTDRAGHPGVAVAADGDFTGLPTRYVLIFNPDTGQLQASERWLTKTSGQLGIRVPASVSYRQFNK